MPGLSTTSPPPPPVSAVRGAGNGKQIPGRGSDRADETRPLLTSSDDNAYGSSGNDRAGEDAETNEAKPAPVTWMSLPHKGQLAIIMLARLSEPVAERSFSAYVFAQLSGFDPSLSPGTVTAQGGVLTASFAAAQFVTAIVWGRAADSPRLGRKTVLLVGLSGTALSLIGIGFSTSFTQMLCWRLVAGALNGNVGVLRTMVAEIVVEKRFQSRAFLLVPMCFNVGVVIGPLMGGFLADPVNSMPGLFGPGGRFAGGQEAGVGWMTAFPYALPSLVGAGILLAGALLVLFGLKETHVALKEEVDYGRRLRGFLFGLLSGRRWRRRRRRRRQPYSRVVESSPDTTAADDHVQPKADVKLAKAPAWREIFTRNVVLTLVNHHMLAMHISMFNTLLFLLLPAPSSANEHAHLPFSFTGGLGLSTEQMGLATAVIGIVGLPLQILVYPSVSERLGTLASFKLFLPFSALAYALLPYLTLLPGIIAGGRLPGWALWPCLSVVLALQVVSRTFVLPCATILLNNCSPARACLGTIHGVGQSASSGARMIGPLIGGLVQGWGLKHNCVGAVWWGMAAVAGINWGVLWALKEGH